MTNPPISDEPPSVVYAIDADDVLMDVDDNWFRFAELNGGGLRLHPKSVIGKSIWDFIRDDTLQKIYRSLIRRARTQRDAIEFGFRCDSPQFRQYMHMRIKATADGVVRFVSTTRRVEQRSEGPRVTAAFSGSKSVIRCSICNLYRTSSGRWTEAVELLQQDAVLDQDRRATIFWSDGCCTS